MNKSENALVDQVICDVHYWTKIVASSLCDVRSSEEGDNWTSHPESIHALRKLLGNQIERENIENVLRDVLSGFAHSIFVTLDGGSKMADEVQLRLLDQNDQYLCTYLHEIFAARMMRSLPTD